MQEDVPHGTDLLHLGKAEAETEENLTMAYKPVKKRISPVEMKILLTDDNPVYERPRRMFYADRKIVDDGERGYRRDGCREGEEVRRQARENIVVIQEENQRTFNANRRTEPEYAIDELVAIRRTQYGVGLKLKPKYLGPYKIVKMRRGRYTVEKTGVHEGPGRTPTMAEFMKRWDPSFGPNERAGWPNVGNDGHDEQT
ncbi:uncharacterized protein LOC129251203 [Anastrepha obliqua]|uniref:uncharacterized protein LOC129251203 n=1 Tax=Anastrepha obliqua TaxID=95512 RepID=UPI002409ADB4|nr:uncharacterized protein LOC129251203 [Anastrepha obliqua]